MRVMLDLETLGHGPRAAVVQIGAVFFTVDGPIPNGFLRNVSLSSALEFGEVTAETIEWWLRQDTQARLGLLSDPEPISLPKALLDLTSWWSTRQVDEVWAHASFDPVILGEAFRATGITPPWTYRDIRDLRTLFEMHRPPEVWRMGTHHNARDDALHQATRASMALGFVQEAVTRLFSSGLRVGPPWNRQSP